MKEKIQMALRLGALLVSVVILSKVQAYDIVDRFQTLDDKWKTQEMMRPFGHDFVFDISAALNKNLLDVVDEAEDTADRASAESSTAAKVAIGEEFTSKYNNTEQFVRFAFNFGIPLPSFGAFDIQWKPNLRVNAGVGLLIAFRPDTVTAETILEYVGNDIPQEIKDAIVSNYASIPENADIIQTLIDSSAIDDTAETRAYVGKYYMPKKNVQTTSLETYIKPEAKVGIYTDYKVDDRWDGFLNIYALGRADFRLKADAATISQNSDAVADLPDELNTTVATTVDYALRYNNGNLRVMGAIEEIKLFTLSDNKDKGGELIYDIEPLFRLHGEYLYKMIGFDLRPFAGVHKREGYGFGEGIYAGADVGFFVWDDRIGVQMRGQIDDEHFTFAPRIKLWLMQLEYTLKQPVKSEKDGLKLSAMHSLNFRLFF